MIGIGFGLRSKSGTTLRMKARLRRARRRWKDNKAVKYASGSVAREQVKYPGLAASAVT